MAVKKLMMIAALVACTSPAFAGSLVSTWSCKYSRFYGYSNCMTTWTRVPDPVRDLEQERLDAIARQKEDAKWDVKAMMHGPKSDSFVVWRTVESAYNVDGQNFMSGLVSIPKIPKIY